MVKIIFLAIMLVNIVFFFWQLRIGAPGIYLPPNYEKNIISSRGTQKIMLLSEMSELSLEDSVPIQQAEALTDRKKGIDTLVATAEQPTILAINETEKLPDSLIITENYFTTPLSDQRSGSSLKKAPEQWEEGYIPSSFESFKYPIHACYQLKEGEYTQGMFTPKNEKNGFKLALFEQEKQNISSYLLLTEKSDSYQQAKKMEQEIKQQGVDNLWLFRQGLFIRRISLGLFTTEEQANKAKELYSKQIDHKLEVVPSYKIATNTYIKIIALDKRQLTIFEQEFSQMIAEKIECSKASSTLP